MASNLRYYLPTDRVTGTPTLETGTARTGYGVTLATDLDPSTPTWITGTSIGYLTNFGAPQRIDTVYILAHNLYNASNLHLQMHSAATGWGAPDGVDMPITIPAPYGDGFTYHIRVDVAAFQPTVGSRTRQWLRIANLSANNVTVAIGEVWMAAIAERQLAAGSLRWPFEQPRQRLTAMATSKHGVDTVYDYGGIERKLIGSIPATDQDVDDIRNLEAVCHYNATPFPITLSPADSKARWAEPMLVKFIESPSAVPYGHTNLTEVRFAVKEMGRGELLAA